MGPLVSVVIPTRNRLTLLAQTLHTVLAQQVELEVIVVDEGSSDLTPGWLASRGDPRVRTIRHDEPRGLPAARNAGAALARGRWVAFVDEDDLWLPDKLEGATRCPAMNPTWLLNGTPWGPRRARPTVPIGADLRPLGVGERVTPHTWTGPVMLTHSCV